VQVQHLWGLEVVVGYRPLEFGVLGRDIDTRPKAYGSAEHQQGDEHREAMLG
jgi:hypothetical protein